MASLLKSDFFRTTFVPLILLFTSPLIVIALWQINILYEGERVSGGAVLQKG